MSSNLHFLVDESNAKSSQQLDTLWQQSSTFVILPEKLKEMQSDLAVSLETLPNSLQKDHFVLLTSGSTGHPRLVVGSKENARELVQVLYEVQQSQEIKNIIGTLPLSYSFGLINQWVLATELKLRYLPCEGLANPTSLMKLLEEAPQSMLCLVGAQVELMRQTICSGRVFPNVKRLHFAGGRFPQHSMPFLNEIFPNALIFNNYGCVEAMPRLTLRLATDSSNAQNIGKPLPGVTLTSDPEQRLIFKSPYSAKAVIDRGELTYIDQQSWTQTGDLGTIQSNGSWVLEGRENAIFKRYGEKVSLTEIEALFRQKWSNEISFYKDKDRNGEDGYVTVLNPHPTKEEVTELLQTIRSGLARPLWPLALVSTDEIPKLPSGKPDILRLPKIIEQDGRVHWRQRL